MHSASPDFVDLAPAACDNLPPNMTWLILVLNLLSYDAMSLGGEFKQSELKNIPSPENFKLRRTPGTDGIS